MHACMHAIPCGCMEWHGMRILEHAACYPLHSIPAVVGATAPAYFVGAQKIASPCRAAVHLNIIYLAPVPT